MRQKTVNVYNYNELSEKAKEKVLEKMYGILDYPWHSENKAVLKEFESIFPITIKDYSYGDYNSYIKAFTNIDDNIDSLRGVRLLKYIINNYYTILFPKAYYGKKNRKYHLWKREEAILTGYCVGNDILQPIYRFLHNPNSYDSFSDILKECAQEWVESCNRDIEYYYSKENMEEAIEVNGYEFDENGNLA